MDGIDAVPRGPRRKGGEGASPAELFETGVDGVYGVDHRALRESTRRIEGRPEEQERGVRERMDALDWQRGEAHVARETREAIDRLFDPIEDLRSARAIQDVV